MDIYGLSTAMAMDQVQTAWSYGMLAKTMDTASSMSDMLTSAIAAAPSPSLESMVYPDTMGTAIDLTV